MRKYKISFQINVLKEEVLAECHIFRLRARAKRGRAKKVPSALNFTNVCDTNAKEDFSDDGLVDQGSFCKYDAIVV